MQLETLFDVWNSGARLYARCAWGRREGLKSVRACIGNAELDVASLLWTRGRDFPIAMLSSRLRCPVCGSRKVSVRISIPGNADAKRAGAEM
jgi:hypothetical protein